MSAPDATLKQWKQSFRRKTGGGLIWVNVTAATRREAIHKVKIRLAREHSGSHLMRVGNIEEISS